MPRRPRGRRAAADRRGAGEPGDLRGHADRRRRAAVDPGAGRGRPGRSGGVVSAAARSGRASGRMRILVTGSSGHLGEALVRVLGADGLEVVGLDVLPSPCTAIVGSVADRAVVRRAIAGRRRGGARGDAAQAARRLPPPPGLRRHERHRHAQPARGGGRRRASAGSSSRARRATFGRALTPPAGAPAAWITEDVAPVPQQHLRRHQGRGRGPVRARPPRPRAAVRRAADVALLPRGRRPRATSAPRTTTLNLKVNELLYRRVDLEDVVGAHRLALDRAPEIGFARLHHQRDHAVRPRGPRRPAASTPRPSCGGGAPRTRRSTPPAAGGCSRRSTASTSTTRARDLLGWTPRYDFAAALERLAAGRTRAASSRSRSARRATTPSRSGRTRRAERVRACDRRRVTRVAARRRVAPRPRGAGSCGRRPSRPPGSHD